MHLLVVEDSLSYQNMYKDLISKLGCGASYFDNGKKAWDALRQGLEVDLIITDVIMPIMDGKEFSKLVRSDYQYNNIPLIVSSSIGQAVTLKDFFNIGVNDYFTKPLDEEVFSCRVIAHLRTRMLLKKEASLMKQVSSFNERLIDEVKLKTAELIGAKNEVINKLAKVAEYKDDVTGSHIYRVRAYTEELSRMAGIPEEKVEPIGLGSMMHDIGKIAIPDAILKKKGKLTLEEREVMETHPLYGEELFSDSSYFIEARNIAGGHHEKWDGKGYPRKLKGEAIPIEARIVAIADVFDALLSPRPYKEPFSIEHSLSIMKKDSGSHFDPNLVELFFRLVDQGIVDQIIAKYPYT